MTAEQFSYPALCSVAIYCFSYLFARRYAKTKRLPVRFIYHHCRADSRLTAAIQSLKFRIPAQTDDFTHNKLRSALKNRNLRKLVRSLKFIFGLFGRINQYRQKDALKRLLCGQLLSALKSSSRQDLATIFGAHSFSETVLFCAMSFLRLKCSKHCCPSFNI